MIETYIPNYLFGTVLTSIDNKQLAIDCLDAEKLIRRDFNGAPDEQEGYIADPREPIAFTTSKFKKYNIFTYPSTALTTLYDAIRTVVGPCLPDEPHVIQSWLNVYHNGESIPYHFHWHPDYRAIHGFYCVQTEVMPSSTTYKIPGERDTVINSKDGLLVFGKSDGDQHASSKWFSDTPRITIAFDLIPLSTVPEPWVFNHYLPFKS